MITKAFIEFDIEKNKTILSLLEDNENLRLSYQEQSEEYSKIFNKFKIYEDEFWIHTECVCYQNNYWKPQKNCTLCNWKWFYFNKN